MKPITRAQRAVFALMKASSFNQFDSRQVVADLLQFRATWIGCIWGRFCHFAMLPLRDIATGAYNADTLYLTTRKENIAFITNLAQKWLADEIGYYYNGQLHGVIDANLQGLDGGPGMNDTHDCSLALGASPEPDVAYFRLWWD